MEEEQEIEFVKSGTSSSEKEWKLLQLMMFLKNVDNTHERPTGNFDAKICDTDDIYTNSCETEYIVDDETSISNYSCADSFTNSEISSQATSSRATSSKRQNKVDSALVSATSQMADIINFTKNYFTARPQPESPSELFFRGIARQVELANISPVRWAKLQKDVLNIVTNKLNENTS